MKSRATICGAKTLWLAAATVAGLKCFLAVFAKNIVARERHHLDGG
jgi:hypothetical protein